MGISYGRQTPLAHNNLHFCLLHYEGLPPCTSLQITYTAFNKPEIFIDKSPG